MKELGWTKCEIKDLGEISLNDAIAKTLSLEKTAITMDAVLEAQLVKQYKEAEGDLQKLPYSDEEVANKIALLEFDFNQFEGQQEEGDQKKKTITCPECGHEFEI